MITNKLTLRITASESANKDQQIIPIKKEKKTKIYKYNYDLFLKAARL